MVSLISPVVEHLIDLWIPHELLDKDIHFQGFKLRLTEKCMRILLAVIISEKLPCQIVVSGAYFSTVGRVVKPQLFVERKRRIIVSSHYRTSTSSDSERRSVIFTLMVPQSSGIS